MTSEWATLASIRLCVILYVWHLWIGWPLTEHRQTIVSGTKQRNIWTYAYGLFVLHVIFAFDHYHSWRHDFALEHTADVTQQVTGIRTGVGIYANYVFLVIWSIDVARCWLCPDAGHNNKRLAYRYVPWFFAFMFFNATVVFGPPLWKAVFMCVMGSILMKRIETR